MSRHSTIRDAPENPFFHPKASTIENNAEREREALKDNMPGFEVKGKPEDQDIIEYFSSLK